MEVYTVPFLLSIQLHEWSSLLGRDTRSPFFVSIVLVILVPTQKDISVK
jgi:hypothetical protein